MSLESPGGVLFSMCLAVGLVAALLTASGGRDVGSPPVLEAHAAHTCELETAFFVPATG